MILPDSLRNVSLLIGGRWLPVRNERGKSIRRAEDADTRYRLHYPGSGVTGNRLWAREELAEVATDYREE